MRSKPRGAYPNSQGGLNDGMDLGRSKPPAHTPAIKDKNPGGKGPSSALGKGAPKDQWTNKHSKGTIR